MNKYVIIVAWMFGGLFCLNAIHAIILALAINWNRLISKVRRHVCLQIASRRVYPVVALLLISVLIPFSNAAHIPVAVFLIYSFCGRAFVEWLIPPSVLFLGVSGTSANELLLALQPAMFPAKVIHFLELGNAAMDPNVGIDVKLQTQRSTSRVGHGAGWQEIVWGYLQLCDCILVDMRSASFNLHTELGMIERLENKGKVVLLQRGTSGSITPPKSNQLSTTWVCTSQDDAFQILRMQMSL